MSSVLHKHKQTVEAMVYITIFGIDEYIMDKEMTLRGGLKTMFKKYLIKKLGTKSIEHTNQTKGEWEILRTNQQGESKNCKGMGRRVISNLPQ